MVTYVSVSMPMCSRFTDKKYGNVPGRLAFSFFAAASTSCGLGCRVRGVRG